MTNLLEPVRLPHAVYEEIVAHARAGKPEEVCGILRGQGLEAFAAVRGRNIAPERIENYEVDPQTLLLQFRFEDEGDAMMGIYHSHPVSVAYPSATDAWNAHYGECVYFICSLEFDDAPVLRAFRMTTHWVEVDAEALQAALPFYETRPRLFACYQPAGVEVAPALQPLAAVVPAPFYVVYARDERGAVADTRVVSIAEHAVRVG